MGLFNRIDVVLRCIIEWPVGLVMSHLLYFTKTGSAQHPISSRAFLCDAFEFAHKLRLGQSVCMAHRCAQQLRSKQFLYRDCERLPLYYVLKLFPVTRYSASPFLSSVSKIGIDLAHIIPGEGLRQAHCIQYSPIVQRLKVSTEN